MKKFLFAGICILTFSFFTTGQVGIGTGSLPPNSSAMLEIKSNSRGLLFPRMTTAQRVAISNPSQGLVVFDTVLTQLFLFDKANWVPLNVIPADGAIGDMLYWDGTKWTRLPVGTDTQPLVICNGVPQWGYCPGSLASVSTSSPSAIAPAAVTLGGNVSSNGGSSVSSKGFTYDTLSNPTILFNRVNVGSGIGTFNTTITGLIPNKQYYIRSFAINNAGVTYGNEVNATTPLAVTGGGATDASGNVYTSVIIGGQEWLAQNLKTTKYSTGSLIATSTASGNTWDSLSNLGIGTWGYLGGNSAFNNPYGKLYNWYAVTDLRNVCPTGWHVSTEGDWEILWNYLGGDVIAGGALKEAGVSHWQSPNTGATNATGFSAVGGGSRGGAFGQQGNFWTPNDGGGCVVCTTRIILSNTNTVVSTYSDYRESGNSVRCVKN